MTDNIREKLEILRQKLSGMISGAMEPCAEGEWCESCKYFHSPACTDYLIADHLIANGVTVQEYAYWTEVVSVGDKICAHCSNCLTGHEARNYAALAIGHRHCRWCGARMLHKPPKGE